jgi:hypothetical protein
MRTLLALVIIANAACLRSTEFKCESNAQCGASGTCELGVGFCSFPDSQCGQRFGDSAGPYANQCVGGGVDGGADAPVGHDGPTSDAPPGDASSTCGSNYAVIASYPGHQYELIATAESWNAQVAACAHTSPLSYLAIPDEAAEVTALDTLVTAGTYWVGVSESGGSYTTVKNATQTFLPWASGQPSTTGDSHCVEVAGAGSQVGDFDLDKCSDPRPAICECEP